MKILKNLAAAAAISFVAAVGAQPAHAAEQVNGLNLNGLNLNGLSLNGLNLNGWTVNGVNLNGEFDLSEPG